MFASRSFMCGACSVNLMSSSSLRFFSAAARLSSSAFLFASYSAKIRASSASLFYSSASAAALSSSFSLAVSFFFPPIWYFGINQILNLNYLS